MASEREKWLQRPADDGLARKLRGIAWVVSAVVLTLVGSMQRVRIPLPDGWSAACLPPFHAVVNALAALCLVGALVFIKRGQVACHKRAIQVAMGLSVVFLLSYVAYHMTTDPTRYGGTGWLRGVYLFLLATHILSAAVSLPFILFAFISGWTNQFVRHRKLVRWVWPLWLYVTVTGPVCYLLLRPWYRG